MLRRSLKIIVERFNSCPRGLSRAHEMWKGHLKRFAHIKVPKVANKRSQVVIRDHSVLLTKVIIRLAQAV